MVTPERNGSEMNDYEEKWIRVFGRNRTPADSSTQAARASTRPTRLVLGGPRSGSERATERKMQTPGAIGVEREAQVVV